MRSKLFIDKLSLTLNIPIADHGHVKGAFDYACLDDRLERESNVHSELFKNYAHAYRLNFGPTCFCTVQLQPRRPGHRFIRLEWNPNLAQAANPESIGMIHALLSECVPSYESIQLFDARITRIDLAFDVYRTRVESVFISSLLRKNSSGQYVQLSEEFLHTGYVNARYVGKPGSDKYLLIYDKDLEAANREIRPIPAIPRYPIPRTRFELRLRNVGTLSQLAMQGNPWLAYSVTSRMRVSGIKNDFAWQHFLDSCSYRGAQAALSMIPNRRKRTEYRNALYESTPPQWWNPEQIWRELVPAISSAWGLSLNPEMAH